MWCHEWQMDFMQANASQVMRVCSLLSCWWHFLFYLKITTGDIICEMQFCNDPGSIIHDDRWSVILEKRCLVMSSILSIATLFLKFSVKILISKQKYWFRDNFILWEKRTEFTFDYSINPRLKPNISRPYCFRDITWNVRPL